MSHPIWQACFRATTNLPRGKKQVSLRLYFVPNPPLTTGNNPLLLSISILLQTLQCLTSCNFILCLQFINYSKYEERCSKNCGKHLLRRLLFLLRNRCVSLQSNPPSSPSLLRMPFITTANVSVGSDHRTPLRSSAAHSPILTSPPPFPILSDIDPVTSAVAVPSPAALASLSELLNTPRIWKSDDTAYRGITPFF